MEAQDRLISRLDSQYFPPRGARLVVAVSGGVDSVVLLHILILLAATGWNWDLVVAHFNHQLRKSAKADAKFVAGLAKGLGLKFVLGSADVAKLAKARKLTIEEAGRVARYGWLNQLMKRHRAAVVVTAHTADDQVETVVMNWVRGGLIRALAGMRVREGNIWRPFLPIPKTELLKFAKHYHLQFKEDKSNQKLIYTRNLVRHRILPMLTQINPGVYEVFLRNAASFSAVEDWLDKQMQDIYKRVSLPSRKNEVFFDDKKFRRLDKFPQKELLLLAIRKLKGDSQDIKNIHLDEILKVLSSPRGAVWAQLPGKLFVYRGYGKISFSRYPPKFVSK